ncbi:hypothetical protein GCM10011579_081080 [Streptomyces albiflavescens]|uniref:Oxidoreductase n=1 Tax=Streptomyces albiflavescens TaxID=1623582 RepID=A0A917YD74_9ACTN|nr:hypothetical protein GCM10011579_081080 [Streptomyces albiflavescens]
MATPVPENASAVDAVALVRSGLVALGAVDYALDAVGGDLLTPAVAALAPGGRLVAYSSAAGPSRRTTCSWAPSR